MQEVVWGMIGCGDVTENKTGPALYKATGSRLKGVYNRTQEKANSWTERHGHGMVYPSVEKLLEDPEINVVYIATPPASHHLYAIQSLRAGKIPLIEKPMASSYEQCLEIISVAEEVGLPVYVNFYRRGLEKIRKIKQLLKEGAIGQPLLVEVHHINPPDTADFDREHLPWRVTPEAGGGKALDTQVHVLDYLTYFFGSMKNINGVAANLRGLYEVEDTTTASFQFENGTAGSAVWCYVADTRQDEVIITGTKGRMNFSGTGVTDLTVNGESYVFDAPEHVGLPYMQMVMDEIRGVAKSPANTVEAAEVIRFFEKVYQL